MLMAAVALPTTARFNQSEQLQEVYDKLADILKQLANEPSVGLYYVQQHALKATPAVVALRDTVRGTTAEAVYATEDVRAAATSVRTMKGVGPPTIDAMLARIQNCEVLRLSPKPGGSSIAANPAAAMRYAVGSHRLPSVAEAASATTTQPPAGVASRLGAIFAGRREWQSYSSIGRAEIHGTYAGGSSSNRSGSPLHNLDSEDAEASGVRDARVAVVQAAASEYESLQRVHSARLQSWLSDDDDGSGNGNRALGGPS
eukprot:SM000049S16783  [mRNA]  locus=s49:606185:607763:- [translate_table: standard]